jgi:hypothetical protein
VVRQLWAVVSLVIAPACVPWVVPPSKVGVGGGVVTSVPERLRQSQERDAMGYESTVTAPTDGYGLTAFQASLHPMQLFPSLRARRFDVGAGYRMEKLETLPSPMHGGFFQLDGYPLVNRTANGVTRVGLRGGLDGVYGGPIAGAGFGGSMGVVAEASGNVEGRSFAEGGGGMGVAGLVGGEMGLGAYAGVSYRRFRDGDYWFPSVGVYGTVPGAVGLLCCLK